MTYRNTRIDASAKLTPKPRSIAAANGATTTPPDEQGGRDVEETLTYVRPQPA